MTRALRALAQSSASTPPAAVSLPLSRTQISARYRVEVRIINVAWSSRNGVIEAVLRGSPSRGPHAPFSAVASYAPVQYHPDGGDIGRLVWRSAAPTARPPQGRLPTISRQGWVPARFEGRESAGLFSNRGPFNDNFRESAGSMSQDACRRQRLSVALETLVDHAACCFSNATHGVTVPRLWAGVTGSISILGQTPLAPPA